MPILRREPRTPFDWVSPAFLMGWMAMGVIVVLSGVAVVYYQHATRMAYARLTVLQSERDRLQVAHGQLLLERSTLSTEARVEEIARHRLHMAPPASNAIWVLEATAP